jgi:hypothetical protein
MKSIETFLSDLANQDIKLWMDGDRLRCNAPQGLLTPEIQTELNFLSNWVQRSRLALEPFFRLPVIPNYPSPLPSRDSGSCIN